MTESNNYYKNKDKWGPYLAGLIEGDGTIIVHDGNTKVKYSPIIEIVFNKYPLLSSKYLDYKDWESVLTLIDVKSSFTDVFILDRSKNIITNFNSTRVNITWDHLNNNYYESLNY